MISLTKISRSVNNLQLLIVSHLPRRMLHRATMMKLYPSMRGRLNRPIALMLIFPLEMTAGLITY